MLQIEVDDIEPILASLTSGRWPFYKDPREVWRHYGDREGGQREFWLQDPDGYLVLIAQEIGERPLSPGRPA
jgi:hypothetical protein